MVNNTIVTGNASTASLTEKDEKKHGRSESSVNESQNEETCENPISNKTASPPIKTTTKIILPKPERNKSLDNTILEEKKSYEIFRCEKSETGITTENIVTSNQESFRNPKEAETRDVDVGAAKKKEISEKQSDVTVAKVENVAKTETGNKKPSEIPKLKSLAKTNNAIQRKQYDFPSKLPVKITKKQIERKQNEEAVKGLNKKLDSLKIITRSQRARKEFKGNDDVKTAMVENFDYLIPLYEKEFEKITEVWMNTVYCSLTMRTNLVKLLFQAFPNIKREQFQEEDEQLLQCISNAKNSTKSEAENLIKFLRSLMANREKTIEEYTTMSECKEVAEYYNHDWKKLSKKVADVGEEAKKLQMETPELQRKKETTENNLNEKIQRMENHLCRKEDEMKKLLNQLNLLKQKESAYKENVLLKCPDYTELKADVQSLISTQKEFDELKTKYMIQNFTFEAKIKDLEDLLQEKRKILAKERSIKNQMQAILNEFQMQQKRLSSTVGTEQIDYVLGRSFQDRNKRREQLWIAAVKLVLKGFLIQMKKLERDRNKMLIELQSNDSNNFSNLAAIIQKDNFIKSIQQQINDLQDKCSSVDIS